MNKKIEMLFVWIVMLSMLLQGCMPVAIGVGQVEALQPGTTLWIIQRNIDEAWGTLRFQKDNILLLAAYMKSAEAWGYVFLNAAEKNILDSWAVTCGATGNVVGCATMGDLVTKATGEGFKWIQTVPPALVTAFSDSKSWLHVMSNVPILVLPGAFMDIPYEILPPAGTIE